MPRVGPLVGGHKFFPERGDKGEWIGSIAEKKGDELHVLTVGIELSEGAIKEWMAGTMKLIREKDDPEVELPDYHARKRG